MASLHRGAALLAAVVVLGAVFVLLDPSPPAAKANVACDIGIAPGAAVTGAIGIGNPVGDACEAITDPVLDVLPDPLDPLNDAVNAIGKGIFEEIASWASDGAVWLLGEVAVLTDKTTSPHLLSKGFLRQYRQMALIAALMAALMCLFAVMESVSRGDGGMLWRVFLVNVPLAAIATSAAYVVVQLLIGVTDGLSEAVTRTTSADTAAFFKDSVEALGKVGAGAGSVAGEATGTGGTTGAASGAVAVPLFVGFIAAIVVAFAAFFVWIELLMRDAAIYVVALFMPLAIAAAIWPRWVSALRRTCELVIVVVFSKFVIVAIIALAASLLAHSGGEIEQVLAAGAMLLLACFAPFMLFKLVPFAEGAISSAYNRQGAAGGAVQAVHTASSVQMMRHAAHANWAMNGKGGGGTSASKGGGGGGDGGASTSKGRPGGSGGGSGGASASEAAGASGGAASAAALPVVAGTSAAKGRKAAGERLAASGTGQAASESSGRSASGGEGVQSGGEGVQSGGRAERAPRPSADGGPERSTASGGSSGVSGGGGPEPTEAHGGDSPTRTKAPRPSADVGATERKSASKEPKG